MIKATVVKYGIPGSNRIRARPCRTREPDLIRPLTCVNVFEKRLEARITGVHIIASRFGSEWPQIRAVAVEVAMLAEVRVVVVVRLDRGKLKNVPFSDDLG